MENIQNKQSDGDKLAQYFQKKYGEVVYSGTLAIEVALVAAGVKKGDYVILPDGVCYRILLSVTRLQAKPIIVTPSNGVTLIIDDVKSVFKKYNIKAIILVHNMGLPVDIKSFKEFVPKNTAIIEDAAQAWKLKYSGNAVGKHSDYVVTSFGKTKPLNLGFGGALFSNNILFKKYLDFNNKICRANSDAILPYALPETIRINIKKLIMRGDARIRNSQLIAATFLQNLDFLEIRVWHPGKSDVATWQRFPIFTNSKGVYKKLLVSATKHNIIYQLPHKLKLSATPMALKNNRLVVDNNIGTRYQINLSTTTNKAKNIKLWTKELKDLLK